MERRDFNKFLLGVPVLPWVFGLKRDLIRFHAEEWSFSPVALFHGPRRFDGATATAACNHKFRLTPESYPVVTNPSALLESVARIIAVPMEVRTSFGNTFRFAENKAILSSCSCSKQIRGQNVETCLVEFSITEFGPNFVAEDEYKVGEFHKAFLES